MQIVINDCVIRFTDNYFTIIDSYKITDSTTMLMILDTFFSKTKYKTKRRTKDLINEWKTHNLLYKYGLFKSHTKDCDFEENEKLGRLIVYKIFGILFFRG